MDIFISWSGARSNKIALALRDWLKSALQFTQPWMSERDISSGARWNDEINSQLDKTQFGIICLTPENLIKPWVMFEAGAIAKSVDSARIVPLLFQTPKSSLGLPLSQFQSEDVELQGLINIAKSINQVGKGGLDDTQIEEIAKALWPVFSEKIEGLASDVSTPAPERTTSDILEELVGVVRRVDRKMSDVHLQQSTESALRSLSRRQNLGNALSGFSDTNLSAGRDFYKRIATESLMARALHNVEKDDSEIDQESILDEVEKLIRNRDPKPPSEDE